MVQFPLRLGAALRVSFAFLLVILMAIETTASLAAEAQSTRIKVLIVDGYSNHDWRLNTALIRGILEPTGLFDITVSTAPETATSPGWDVWRPDFHHYDVVMQTCNDIHGGPKWPEEVQKSFESFVSGGGGFYAYHSGNNAFPGWTAYEEMVGILWRGKDKGTALTVDDNGEVVRIPPNDGSGTSHGARSTCMVTCLGEHPIHAGMPREWITPELEVYTYARGPAKNIQVISWAVDAHFHKRWPIEWTVTYGNGRVYSSTMGHVWKGDIQPVSMRCAAEQTLMVRALQWLAKRPVNFPIPADFPTRDAVSIRPEIPIRSATTALVP